MKTFLLSLAVLIVLFVVGAKTTARHKNQGAPVPKTASNGTVSATQFYDPADTMGTVSIKVASGK